MPETYIAIHHLATPRQRRALYRFGLRDPQIVRAMTAPEASRLLTILVTVARRIQPEATTPAESEARRTADAVGAKPL